MATPDLSSTPAPALSPSTGRVAGAVLLGLLYGLLAYLPFSALFFLVMGAGMVTEPPPWVAGAERVDGVLGVVLGVVLPALFIFWQVRREYRRAPRPPAGRIVMAALLGLVYSFLVILPFFLWGANEALAHMDTGDGSTAPGYVLSVLGVVLPAPFAFWQVRREYRRAAKVALEG